MEKMNFKEMKFILVMIKLAEEKKYKITFHEDCIQVTYPIEYFNRKISIYNSFELMSFCVDELGEKFNNASVF